MSHFGWVVYLFIDVDAIQWYNDIIKIFLKNKVISILYKRYDSWSNMKNSLSLYWNIGSQPSRAAKALLDMGKVAYDLVFVDLSKN